jgi:hypothetical protein
VTLSSGIDEGAGESMTRLRAFTPAHQLLNTSAMRLLLIFALAACGTTFDAEEAVTIQQGVYGLTTSGCDTGNCEDSPYEHAPITITPTGGGSTISMTSDGDGFFEAALEPGEYKLCVHSCTSLTIAAGTRVRRDFVSGPGGGIWCVDGVCRPEE